MSKVGTIMGLTAKPAMVQAKPGVGGVAPVSQEEKTNKIIRYALWGGLGAIGVVVGILLIKKYKK